MRDGNRPDKHFVTLQVKNATHGQQVLIHIANFSKTKSLYRNGMAPVFRSSTCFPTWDRVPASSCYYYMCAPSKLLFLHTCSRTCVYLRQAAPVSDMQVGSALPRFRVCICP